ncbi:activator of 2-hydroxyglutaryl-CoA dehydratase (duplicated HSP70 domain) [Desulforapulum autotrophicum HRM2]|uniref:Activator of 2-hydroxyglutaryl-CoA dehydratase (Duplicated HSP70 domain) n=1 Tax=Desulforapulum autotrophicum (strain ATCC 43914 / DSM 3382 / VKM B-1955 / HRM2) TaxID=177437 RepID=C0QDM9_DESAH|nr:hypothetical protein [Desulforapulum autotrophicum]ACN15293.1 activator of 2-hydroxyglutaryl-CoA dehydratase (duplicated HSP70 domain) [Desulforapulum autotrophicum HRM2]
MPVIQNKGQLWAVIVVLFAPVTAPYFFIRANSESSLKKKIVLVTVFYLCFFIVCTGEFYLFSKEKAYLAMARHTPEERQMIQMSEELMASTIALDEAIKELESMSKVISKRTAIGEALSFIGIVQVKIIRNKNDVERFTSFIQYYKASLEKEGFRDFLFIEDFFINPIVTAYLKGLEEYLADFKSLLNYTFDNFEYIDAKSPLELKNYDAYYLNYRRSVDRYSLLCTQRIKFQRSLLEKHPGLERYLPTMIQTDFLKVWE